MSVRPSSARHIDPLIADLSSQDAIKRDAAVARLTVIGARAVDRLIGLVTKRGHDAGRVAALRALEGIGDPRGLPVALKALDNTDQQVAQAAIALASQHLRGAKGAHVVDRLTAIALDVQRPETVRVAAVRALRDLERKTIAPLLKSLANDATPAVRSAAASADRETTQPADDVAVLHAWIVREGASAPLAAILAAAERARDREASEPPGRQADWATARAAAHLALAKRNSRIGLYDVKESLEKSGVPLPVDTLAALAQIGDASCLEPIAAAHARSTDGWWRDRLLDVFKTIAKREGLTARHAVMKRIAKRWPALTRA